MKTMITAFMASVSLLFSLHVQAQNMHDSKFGRLKKPSVKWTRMAREFSDEFFFTPEAIRIGNNVLLYQHTTGGWPKNENMSRRLDNKELRQVMKQKKNADESTIDNHATTTEIVFLARLYGSTGMEKYRKAVERGLNYIFEAQYDNGGWPQFYPRNYGYYTHITYNDEAMVNVLKMMRDVSMGEKPFAFLPDSVREKANAALYKGIDCILKTQVRRNGKLTVWCAQHDEKTLQPAPARAYELVSLSGSESAGIVLFLMSLPDPSQEVKNSIEGAVEWFGDSKITGLKKEYFTDEEGRPDYRMVACEQDDNPCDVLWARFYNIEDNRPFFCDRDGVKKYDISEIGHERRNGYSWYVTAGSQVLEQYKDWKEKYGK